MSLNVRIFISHFHTTNQELRGCIQKFPDWVIMHNELRFKLSLRLRCVVRLLLWRWMSYEGLISHLRSPTSPFRESRCSNRTVAPRACLLIVYGSYTALRKDLTVIDGENARIKLIQAWSDDCFSSYKKLYCFSCFSILCWQNCQRDTFVVSGRIFCS